MNNHIRTRPPAYRVIAVILAAFLLLFAFRPIPAFAAAEPGQYVLEPSGPWLRGDGGGAVHLGYLNRGYLLIRAADGYGETMLRLRRLGSEHRDNTRVMPEDEVMAAPFLQGNGRYEVTLYGMLSQNSGVVLLETQVELNLDDARIPYLYPSQQISFDDDTRAAELAGELCRDLRTDPEKIGAVYRYVVDAIAYDEVLAETVRPGYRTDADRTLEDGKGICLDIAALLCVMLRSQGIPARIECGRMKDGTLHAWVSAYSDHSGKAENHSFAAGSWTSLDPTFAIGGGTVPGIKSLQYGGENYRHLYSL